MTIEKISPFNSALETGVRTLAILVASYPRTHDLARLVQYDYLTVHSADVGGPPSLHPPLPMRSGELLVRRGLIEAGLNLMISRSLINREAHDQGFVYAAEEAAGSFFDNMQSPYIMQLRERAAWVVSSFDQLRNNDLENVITDLFDSWMTEFHAKLAGPHGEPQR